MSKTSASWHIEPLDPARHDRMDFVCGVEALDRYIKMQAGQDIARKANAVFVLTEPDAPRCILGYYTLCAYTVTPGEVPDMARKHIPRYPLVSATLIGRLAVSRDRQGQGLGGILLAHALRTASQNAAIVGSCMVVVDAHDELASAFYAAHGFLRLPESLRLVFPMRAIKDSSVKTS